jgi:hypothetical protein
MASGGNVAILNFDFTRESEPMNYRVNFFKDLLNSDGQQFRCLQQSIVIHRARTVERALEAAKHRFERQCHSADWRLHADGVELEISQGSRVH